MKQLVNLFGRQVKTQGNGSPRGTRRRQLHSEPLEQRRLLAGDLLTAHNYAVPEDVNGDWAVTPLDALLVLNHINQAGTNPAGEGLPSGQRDHFVDVTADSSVTPLDALRVLNRISRGEGVDDVLQLHINPRTADNEPFTASAFNPNTRELTVDVGEVFNLEVLYSDLRGVFQQGAAFSLFTDILFEQAGVVEPVLKETQELRIGGNLRQTTGGDIEFAFADDPDNTVTVSWGDFVGNRPAAIQAALGELDADVSVTALATDGDEPFDFVIQFNSFRDLNLENRDLPNLVVTPNFNVDVEATVSDIPPLLSENTINPLAIAFNIDFVSREFGNQPFFGTTLRAGGFEEGDRTGFIGVGGVGPISTVTPDVDFPFDAFRLPVRMTEPVEDFRIHLEPPSDGSENLFFGSEEAIPNDLIRIDLDVDPSVATDGSGVLFVTAVGDSTEVTVEAADATIDTTINTEASLDLTALVEVTGSDQTPTFELTQPARGEVNLLTLTSGTFVVFTPEVDDVTTEPLSFTYTATVNGVSDTGTILVNIADDTVVTVEAGDGSLTAEQNGDPVTLDLAPLVTVTGSTQTPTFAIADEPTRGTVSVTGSTITYTPTAGEVGGDSFTYTATVNGVTGTGTVNVTIDPEAVTVIAADDELAAEQNGGPVSLDLAPLVTVTGSTQAPTFAIADEPARGTVSLSGSTVVYTPAADEVGADSFTYTATVNGVSATGTISVSIDAEEITVDAGNGSLTAEQNGDAETLDLAPLVTVTGSTTTPSFAIGDQPARGTVSVSGSTVTYTPAAGEVGSDSFTYTATVGGVTDSGTINVTIDPQAVAVDAGNGSLTAEQNGDAETLDLAPLVTVTGSTATPTFDVEGQPTRGTVSISGSTVTYTPTAGEVGADSFTYRATVNGVSDTGTINVTIDPEAVTVVAADATLEVEQDGDAETLDLDPLVTVTGSTANPNFTIVDQPTRGTVSISGSTLTYTPEAGEFGSDSLTYRATVNGVSDTGTITVTIAQTEAPPVARNDTFNVVAGVAATFTSVQLTANDSAAQPNPSGLPPQVTAASEIAGTTQGTVAFNSANGSVTYTPPAGFTGTDQFRYTITSEGQTATATVTVNVQEFVPSTISGSIFNDFIESLDNPVRNNVRDAHEPAVGGVSVRLTSPASANAFGEDIDLTRMTTGQGEYSFENLAPGTYTVTFDAPETLIFGSRVNDSGLAVDGSGRSFVVEIPEQGGQDFANLNFTVLGKTGAASGSHSLLVSQYMLTNPNSPNNVNNPDFGLATMILDADGSQELFELGSANEDVLFAEIAVGQSGQSAILTVIMADGSAKSAILGEDDFLVSSNDAVVHVLRNFDSLTFMDSPDELLTEEYGQYRSAVDEILASNMF